MQLGSNHPLITRPDLLARAAQRRVDERITWAGLKEKIGDYGTSGGSASDYRAIVEALAALERGEAIGR